MIADLAVMAIGASLFSAVVLIVAHLFSGSYEHLKPARWLGSALMVNLMVLQLLHYQAINHDLLLWSSRLYVGNLFCTGPLFYFFCRAVLYPDLREARWKWIAAVPAIIAAFAPSAAMFFAAFVLGSGYFALLAHELINLRSQRQRFAQELTALISVFLVAGMTLVLGMLMPLLSDVHFAAVFALLNSISFLPAMLMVVRYPDVLSRVEEAVQMARASTTLATIDVPSKLDQLRQLMQVDHLFMDENLSLASLSSQLDLSTHQTSELLNHHLGLGFTAYLRRLRVDEACRQLIDEPSASVLSVGLSVGFSSQSTFYTAFKTEQGMSPGRYRQRKSNQSAPT